MAMEAIALRNEKIGKVSQKARTQVGERSLFSLVEVLSGTTEDEYQRLVCV